MDHKLESAARDLKALDIEAKHWFGKKARVRVCITSKNDYYFFVLFKDNQGAGFILSTIETPELAKQNMKIEYTVQTVTGTKGE